MELHHSNKQLPQQQAMLQKYSMSQPMCCKKKQHHIWFCEYIKGSVFLESQTGACHFGSSALQELYHSNKEHKSLGVDWLEFDLLVHLLHLDLHSDFAHS